MLSQLSAPSCRFGSIPSVLSSTGRRAPQVKKPFLLRLTAVQRIGDALLPGALRAMNDRERGWGSAAFKWIGPGEKSRVRAQDARIWIQLTRQRAHHGDTGSPQRRTKKATPPGFRQRAPLAPRSRKRSIQSPALGLVNRLVSAYVNLVLVAVDHVGDFNILVLSHRHVVIRQV